MAVIVGLSNKLIYYKKKNFRIYCLSYAKRYCYYIGSKNSCGIFRQIIKKYSCLSLGAEVITNLIKNSNCEEKDIDEVIMGQVLTGGTGQNPARQASIKSGIPKEKPAYVVNQVCGSGIRSIASGFQSIKSGDSKIVIAGGQENMS